MWHRITMWRLMLQHDVAAAWRMYRQFRKRSRRNLQDYLEQLRDLDARMAAERS